MIYPKPLFIILPDIYFPEAICLSESFSAKSDSSKSDEDFEIGELYVCNNDNKLIPRNEVSPSVFRLKRTQRRDQNLNSNRHYWSGSGPGNPMNKHLHQLRKRSFLKFPKTIFSSRTLNGQTRSKYLVHVT